MNITKQTTSITTLVLALLASFATPASAQAAYPESLSRGRRLISPSHSRASIPSRSFPTRSFSTYSIPSHHGHYNPGHYETRSERVLVRGSTYRVWVPATYRTHHGIFGLHHRELVTPGHFATRCSASRYELRTRRVWIPGHYDN